MTSVASANGPAWKVSGSRLGQVKQQLKTLAGTTTLVGKVTLIEVKIKCGTARTEGGYIEGAGQGAGVDGAAAIVFEQCEVEKPTQCEVVQPIRTVPVKSQLVTVANGQQIDDLFEPTQGTKFVTITFTSKAGLKCPLTTFEVKGNVAALVKPEGVEQVQGELEFPTTPIPEIKKEGGAAEVIGLKLGTEEAKFSGKFGASLNSGASWGAFH